MRAQLQVDLANLAGLTAFDVNIDKDDTFRSVLDYDALKRDPGKRRILVLASQNHRLALTFRERALRDAEQMCAALGQMVGRACRLDLPPPSFK